MPKTVLIVSSGRTGTQFLARYFDANFEDVVGRHEPAPRYRVRLAANAYAAGALSRERMRGLLTSRRRRLEASVDAKLYVESNPFLWGAVDLFDSVYDEPSVVHVVRDPREQVRSSLGHGTASGWKGLANRWLPYWMPRAVEAKPSAAGAGGDWLTRTASLWRTVNERLGEHGPRCADYHFVRYEDLFDDEHSGLRALCAHLGLAFAGAGSVVDPSEPMNRARQDTLGAWTHWTEAQCATLHRIAGPLMERYGYGGEPAWQERVRAGAAET